MDSRIYILTHKRLTEQLSITESAELAQLTKIPENQLIAEEISYIWNISNNYFPTKDWNSEGAKKSFLEKIKEPIPAAIPPKPAAPVSSGYKMDWKKVILAALLLGLLGMSIYKMTQKDKVEITASETIEYAQIFDETKVWLDQGATLTILEGSDSARKVALEGEAVFDVMHDPSKPFTIDLGKNVFAEVLGTSFKAKSTHDGSNGMISVRDGVVKLFSPDDQDSELILRAGEEGELNPEKEVKEKRSVREIRALSSASSDLSFRNTPLNKVFDKLGTHFGITFDYDKATLNCNFNSNSNEQSLDNILSAIQDSYSDLEIYTEDKSEYIITGKCK